MSDKTLPSSVTSYDLLKTLAVLLMLVDHVGFYFYPDNEWFRVVGRMSFPIWFFLVGYARSREISLPLVAGAVILTVANFVAGMPILSLNVLVTIMLIRLALDPLMHYARQGRAALAQVMTVLLLLALPSGIFLEYGTIGLAFAMFGYIVRHRDDVTRDMGGRDVVFAFMAACYIGYGLLQQAVFGFSVDAFPVMGAGVLVICLLLMRFRPVVYVAASARIPAPLSAPVRWMGRHTLAIYVIHLLAFKAAAAILYPDRYPLFHFMWLSAP